MHEILQPGMKQWIISQIFSNIPCQWLSLEADGEAAVLVGGVLQRCPAQNHIQVAASDVHIQLNSICLPVFSRTHTHPFNGPFPGLPRWAGTRKVKPIWILLNQETVSGSGISWAVCKSAPRSRQITTPAPHHSVFLQTGCPSCRPTNSVKAL